MSPRVLVVDDEESLRHMLSLALSKAGYAVWTASSGEEALEVIRRSEPFDFCLTDVRMPGMDGLTFIGEALRLGRGKPTYVAMSAYGDEQLAVEALRRGAFDYVSKPFEPEALRLKLKVLEERRRQSSESGATAPGRPAQRASEIVAASWAMRSIIQTVEKVASFPTTVLLTGETGTGKERVAEALHARGARAQRPFVAVNCAAIPEQLLESELFGHLEGAFTDATRDKRGLFEAADGGTLLLDEVGELPTTLQVKLLRALVEKEVRPVGSDRTRPIDVRVVAATSRDLKAMAKDGTFREDLLYRLNVVTIHVPPLRERPEDVPELTRFFVCRLGERLGLAEASISDEALAVFERYAWPGNVRELENAIERAMVLSDDRGRITLGDLDERFDARADPSSDIPLPGSDLSLKVVLPKMERRLIRRALEESGGNRARTAELLGISPRALAYKLKEYGIR